MSAPTFLATPGSGLARATCGADGSWAVEKVLPEQDVRCLAADPLHLEVVYAGTQGSGVLRSTDRGISWQPAGLEGRVVKSLAVSRAAPGTVYAGTRPAQVYVSHDEGKTWTELDSFRRVRGRWFWFSPAEKPFSAYVQGIALSPTDPGTICAGIEAGATLCSRDGGRTWSHHLRGSLRDCHSLIFHATDGAWAYEGGGSGGGAAFSRDGGQTWQAPRAGLDRHYGWAVAADPARPDVWYVSLSPGPFKAHTDGKAEAYIFRSIEGAPWQKLGGGLPQPIPFMPYALLTDPAAPGHLYAGMSSGEVWHSADLGDTWERLPFSLGGIHRAMVII
jgi:photosystem II stability/assembly factor-like uncharacterized protein